MQLGIDNGPNRERGMSPRFVEAVMFDLLPADTSNAEHQIIRSCWAVLKAMGACDALLVDRLTALHVLTSAKFERGRLDGWCQRHWTRRLLNGDRVDVYCLLGAWCMAYTPSDDTPQHFEAEWELLYRARRRTVACRLCHDGTIHAALFNVAA